MNEVRGLPVAEMGWRDRIAVLPRLRRDPFAFFARAVEDHGPAVRIRVGRERLVVLSDPAVIHELLVRHAAEVEKDEITKRLKAVVGDGLLTSEGETWRARRRMIAPSFQRKDLEGYAATMVRLAGRTADRIPEGVVDVHPLLMSLTVEIVVACLFGSEAALPTDAIGDAVELFMDRFVDELRTLRRLLPDRVLELGRAPYRRAVATLDGVLLDLIRARRAQGGGDDLLARLLAARDDEGGGLDDEGLRDEVVTLFLAGHETTAIALSYTLWLLAGHPTVALRAAEEVDAVTGGRAPGVDDVPRLPWLRAIVNESLRLYPPAWGIGRTMLHDTKVGPWQLLAGDEAVVLQWVMHRSAAHWEAPLRFLPERWEGDLEKRLPKGLYLPFGGGPRTCVGNHFAMMEMILVLATLLQRWRFEAAGPLPALSPAVTLRPKGPVRVRAIPRGR